LPHGTDAAPDRVETIKTALSRFAADSAIHDVHNVRVRDTGAGIPPEVLPDVFEAFVSTRLDARVTGVGLTVAE